ncbi:NUDIX domain-containing protein [Rhodospirillaceae bacterium KN72]|uniref:NUDIX domain-containing protein n=1 Tax=Pacificispira spongiicola TaxID=2729598 RepID=A0A7Y0HF29_9PROT|nr:NUDIX domain-containing protein [Pacificispira spongiicola]NMM44153.1 NUDIX domain-containing protein [Pacificispira spongiicola]
MPVDATPDKMTVIPRDSASLVILRGTVDTPQVLLGKRRDDARFMPGSYVFPGGAVDPGDLILGDDPTWPGTRFHAAALRESWEEIGATIAKSGSRAAPSDAEDPFLRALTDAGMIPAPEDLHYIARAITPPPSRIRFDTRFFMAFDDSLFGTPRAMGELPDVLWVDAVDALTSEKVRSVTKFVLEEALGLWRHGESLTDGDRPIRIFSARIMGQEPQSAGLM